MKTMTEAAARTESASIAGALPAAGQRSWKDYVKRGACWGAPLLVLLAVPLFWSGNTIAAAGGSVVSVLALVACPLGMYFMMRAMSRMEHGGRSETERVDAHAASQRPPRAGREAP